MNTNCYVCEKSIVGQCHDCGRSYCSQHGTSPYCVFCALRHDEPEPLRHALRFDVSVGYDDAKAEADRFAEELGRLKYWDPEAKGPFYEAKKADLPRLEAEAARIKPLADKVIERLMDLLNDPDHTTRHRIVFILGENSTTASLSGENPTNGLSKP